MTMPPPLVACVRPSTTSPKFGLFDPQLNVPPPHPEETRKWLKKPISHTRLTTAIQSVEPCQESSTSHDQQAGLSDLYNKGRRTVQISNSYLILSPQPTEPTSPSSSSPATASAHECQFHRHRRHPNPTTVDPCPSRRPKYTLEGVVFIIIKNITLSPIYNDGGIAYSKHRVIEC